jgi:hypothetical protein
MVSAPFVHSVGTSRPRLVPSYAASLVSSNLLSWKVVCAAPGIACGLPPGCWSLRTAGPPVVEVLGPAKPGSVYRTARNRDLSTRLFGE